MSTKDPNSWAHHDDFAELMVSKHPKVARRILEAADLALTFARALVAKEYERANGMLSLELKLSCPPETLRKKLEEMIQYSGGESEWPNSIHVVTGGDASDDKWTRKAPEDFGWVYVTISGDGYCEAVTPTIAEEGQQLVIRDIEWGRP